MQPSGLCIREQHFRMLRACSLPTVRRVVESSKAHPVSSSVVGSSLYYRVSNLGNSSLPFRYTTIYLLRDQDSKIVFFRYLEIVEIRNTSQIGHHSNSLKFSWVVNKAIVLCTKLRCSCLGQQRLTGHDRAAYAGSSGLAL